MGRTAVLNRLILASVLLGVASPAFAAATTDPTHAIGLLPDQVQWKKGEASDTAWPIGDQHKPGACLELIRWHPGHFSHPHYHEHERYAVVLDGTWWVSTSNVYDPDNNTVPYPKGSVLTDLKGGVHYDGAKPETGDATIAIFMDCPLTSVSAEVKK
jgi:quercetin dioxygenase-like cupin family protein